MEKTINVNSEIGRLKTVLLHRPGKEIENLTPELLEGLLFDDIPYLEVAQEEHDAFAQTLRNCGVEVLYLEKLLAESLDTSKKVKKAFLNQFIDEAGVESPKLKKALIKHLENMQTQEMVDLIIAGIRKKEIPEYESESLYDMVNENHPFICDPMPNTYFTRDPFATIGSGVTINHMRTSVRRRETLFGEYIFKHHPDYKKSKIPMWYNRDETTCVEGGDELILNKTTLAIGISQRTDSATIEKIAKTLFKNKTNFETVLAFQIPHSRAFMHLDTVFTMVDYDKFTIHPGIEGPLVVYKITKKGKEGINIEKQTKELKVVLSEVLNKDVTLIRCGGGDYIDAGREQWNDGSNTLAIAPGEVVVYSRNHVTNKILKEHGLKLHVIPSSELSRGRGGPRCMSMPFYREDLE